MTSSGTTCMRIFSKYIASLITVAIVFLFVLVLPMPASAMQDLNVATYNVESPNFTPRDTDADIVSGILQGQTEPIIWGLQEVMNQNDLDKFTNQMGINFRSHLGNSGSQDRLGIIFNNDKLELERDVRNLSGSGGSRRPLVGQFKFRGGGPSFLFMVNHFNRGDEDKRNDQAEFVRNWAASQNLPVVIVGDFNFDYDIPSGPGNTAFNLLFQNDILKWVQPSCLLPGAGNSCPPRGTQCNPDFNSILDAVVVGGDAQNWNVTRSSIEPFDCSEEASGAPDHRIVRVNFAVDVADSGGSVLPPSASNSVRIVSLLPNPNGNESINEAVELMNTGDTEVDLQGWRIRDLTGSNWGLSGILNPGDTVWIQRNNQSMALNSSGDTIDLISPDGVSIQQVTYTSAQVNQVFNFS